MQAAFDVDEAALLTMDFAKFPQTAIENLREVGCIAWTGVAGAGA